MNYKEKYRRHYKLLPGDFVPCAVCGKQSVDIHHRVHRSQGGTDDIDNLVALCRQCHADVHANKIKL